MCSCISNLFWGAHRISLCFRPENSQKPPHILEEPSLINHYDGSRSSCNSNTSRNIIHLNPQHEQGNLDQSQQNDSCFWSVRALLPRRKKKNRLEQLHSYEILHQPGAWLKQSIRRPVLHVLSMTALVPGVESALRANTVSNGKPVWP